MARLGQADLATAFQAAGASVSLEKGHSIDHTAVMTGQVDILLRAAAVTEEIPGAVVEIGSFRGITTRSLAHATVRTIVAIDPYLGDGGHPKDLAFFETHTSAFPNVQLIRASSDVAFDTWGGRPVSLVFVDAIHEYVHAWYDFAAWGSLVPSGGIVAFHDVDQFPGVNRVCLQILRNHPEWQPWAYAPNIALFRRA
jgi:hypothetical protein